MVSSFADAYLQATLLVSLLSVWVLVGLFYYLNRYTKREYFTIWTAAWLFYALWLTLSLTWEDNSPASVSAMIKQCCVAISAAFLLWGTLRFMNIAVRQTLFGLFMLFLVIWTFIIPQVASNVLQIQLPVFILLGSGSAFAGVCFYRLRRKLPYVGAGMLSLGFLLWGVFLACYPVSRNYQSLHSVGFLVAAVLQLFIAVSMIVLVLEEVRYKTECMMNELNSIRSEKEALNAKVMSSEEQVRRMYDQVRLTEGVQKAYDELRRTQQTVVQQERLRALGQMASGVAHDINNALCPVSAYAELIEKTLPVGDRQTKEYIGHIRRASDDIAHIVARMREFYRPRSEGETLQPIDLNRTVHEVVELTRPRWRDLPQRQGVSIRIDCELSYGLPTLAGDPTEMREALTNLIFNSVDAMPQGGVITISSRLGCPVGGEGRQSVLLILKDNGVGMDPKTRQRCMEPFFTTKAQRGTGLGLAMVYGMMHRHEGSIDIDSELGRGTTITLSFPLPESAPKYEEACVLVSAGSRSLRLLCIDDEPGVRQMMTDCLSAFGHQVETADGGAEGLALFQVALGRGDPHDLVITDLGMPSVDGQQVARGIKNLSSKTPVVMLTGWGHMMKEEGQRSPDVDAVVGKPANITELDALIQRLAGVGSPSRTGVRRS